MITARMTRPPARASGVVSGTRTEPTGTANTRSSLARAVLRSTAAPPRASSAHCLRRSRSGTPCGGASGATRRLPTSSRAGYTEGHKLAWMTPTPWRHGSTASGSGDTDAADRASYMRRYRYVGPADLGGLPHAVDSVDVNTAG